LRQHGILKDVKPALFKYVNPKIEQWKHKGSRGFTDILRSKQLVEISMNETSLRINTDET